jgi:CzcA family heavy metal efflux pump
MMRWIVWASLKFRLMTVAAAAVLLIVGISQLNDMPMDVLPEFGPPTVEVQTEALGLSAAEVEQLVTVPMEQDLLNGIAFLDDIRSESVPGLSRVLLVFEPGTDLFQARQVVAERLTQAHALPNVSKPPQMLQPLSSTNRVMLIGISSKTVTPIEMSVLARWTIMPQLMGLPGVANVSIWGQRDRQLQVQVDPEKLRDRGVSLLQVIDTTGNALWVSPLTFLEASTPGTGGLIDTSNQRLGVYHVSPIVTASDLAKVSVERAKNTKLRLGDVAKVTEDHQPLIGDALTDQGPGLLLVVEKFPNASTLDVTQQVETAIDEMRPGLEGLEFDTTAYRRASYIEKSIDDLTLALIIGALLAVLLLGALFFRLRTALITIAAIPLPLVAAALVLYAFGTTMNAIVLAGLVAALALVIDDAVVGVQNMERRLRDRRLRPNGESTAAAILDATLEMRSPIAYATLIIALVCLPVFFMEGVAGSFFPDVAEAYLLALVTSMVVALTMTPALGILLLPRIPFERGESPLVKWLAGAYTRALAWTTQRSRAVYLATGAVIVSALVAVPFLSSSLLPTFEEQQVLIRWNGAPGTSLTEMDRITSLASRELRALPGVQDVGAHVGRAVLADQVVDINSGELWVSIDPDADYDATVAAVRDVVRSYPGVSASVDTFSNARTREVLSRPENDVTVRIYGEELGVLRGQANRVMEAVSGVDGVSGAHIALPVEQPTLEIRVDLVKAQRHGIKPGDVRRAAATLISGIVAGSLFEDQKVFDVVVWGTPETRGDLTSIRNLLVDTPSGGHVRLGDVADVRIAADPVVIERQGVSRYLDVGLAVSGDRGSVASEVRSRLAEMRFPLEYHTKVLSAAGQPTGRLFLLGITAALGIFLALQAFFGSWRLATLVFLTLPIALTGGILAALLDGGTLSFGSFIGFAAVLGLATRNCLLLLGRYRQLEHVDAESSRPQVVLQGGRERLVPIVTTATATALAMLPLVIMGVRPGYELVHPLAVVVTGGLVTSTWLTLFVMPVLYGRFGLGTAPEGPEALTRRDLATDLGPASPPAPTPTAVVEKGAMPGPAS